MWPPAPAELAVAVAAGIAVATAAALVVPPRRPLARRIRPYTARARAALGRTADPTPLVEAGPLLSGGTIARLAGPPLHRLVGRAGRLLDPTGDERLALLLDQAGTDPAVDTATRLRRHRTRLTGWATAGTTLAVAGALAVGLPAAAVLALAPVGGIAGAARVRGRIERAITARRQALRIQLYTINQQLALHIRLGGGPITALRHLAERGHGTAVAEIRDILRAHAAGLPAADALHRAARRTPEPHAARTWRTLATAATYGADLAPALLRLADDLRAQRTEDLRRAATRRRAATLIPIIALMAPVMLLLILAPLPALFQP